MTVIPLPDFDALWNYNDPAATEQRFRDLLSQAESSNDAVYHLELLTQLARTLGLQAKFDEAHTILDQVEARLVEVTHSRPQIRYLLERGRVYNSSGKREQAQPLFMQAWEHAQQAHEDSYAVDAAHMLAVVESGQAVLEWNLKALAAAEASTQDRAKNWRGSLYNNLGWTYHDKGDYLQALEYFQKALAWQAAKGDAYKIRVAKWSVARCLRSLGQLQEALTIQQSLLTELDAMNDSDGYVTEEIGECLYALGQVDKAKPYFAKAYTELSQDKWLVQNETARLERLKTLSV